MTRCATCGRKIDATAGGCPYCSASRTNAAKVLIALVSLVVISGLFIAMMYGRCG